MLNFLDCFWSVTAFGRQGPEVQILSPRPLNFLLSGVLARLHASDALCLLPIGTNLCTARHYGYHQKEGHRYHVQIRRRGQSITRTLDRLATAKSWIPKIEGDIERHLYVESSRLEKTTLLELLERYERQILPTHKGQQVKAYRLETLHYNCKPFYLVNNTWRQ